MIWINLRGNGLQNLVFENMYKYIFENRTKADKYIGYAYTGNHSSVCWDFVFRSGYTIFQTDPFLQSNSPDGQSMSKVISTSNPIISRSSWILNVKVDSVLPTKYLALEQII